MVYNKEKERTKLRNRLEKNNRVFGKNREGKLLSKK